VISALGRTAVIAVILAGAAGCKEPKPPEVTYEPATVAVIRQVTVRDNNTLELRLASGELYTYDRAVALTDAEPTIGDLLLAGNKANVRWQIIVWKDAGGGDSFRVRAPAFVRGRRVLFATGLSLPMASSFDPGSAGDDGVWANDQAGLCVDTLGFVISYDEC
jgi:hypothetical protein